MTVFKRTGTSLGCSTFYGTVRETRYGMPKKTIWHFSRLDWLNLISNYPVYISVSLYNMLQYDMVNMTLPIIYSQSVAYVQFVHSCSSSSVYDKFNHIS